MANLRDESGNVLLDESAVTLLDENGAEGTTITADAGARERTGYTATLNVNLPIAADAGARERTGYPASITYDVTITADAGARERTGYAAAVNVVALETRRGGGGFPDGYAKRVPRRERESREARIDRIIREAMAPEAEPATATAGAEGPAAVEPDGAPLMAARRQAVIEAAQREAAAARIKVSLKALEARYDAMLADEEAVELLLLAS